MQSETITELRERREALVQAVQSRDLHACLSFLHPTFEAKTLDGQTRTYDEMVRLASFVLTDPNFRERVVIENIHVNEDTATLTVTLYDSNKWFFLKVHGVLRQIETWQRIDGHWLLVREETIGKKNSISL